MGANPEPHQPVNGFYSQRAIVAADSRRPKTTNLLEA
jgi:hypothetical protein